MNSRLLPTPAYKMALVLGILSFSALAMDTARFLVTGQKTWVFLIWNLFLAWIPLGSAAALRHCLHQKTTESRLKGRFRTLVLTTLVLVWFFFFPNAPYMVTDFIHIDGRDFFALEGGRWIFIRDFGLWYDLVMITLFVLAALMVGFWSLFLIQKTVREKAGRPASWAAAGLVLMVAGFGIYLGRFARWNSWDLLLHPISLFNSALENFHLDSLGFSFLFFVFLQLLYLAFYYWSFLSSNLPSGVPEDRNKV